MLVFKLLSACLVAFFSIHPILVLGADEQWVALHISTLSLIDGMEEASQHVLEKFPEQTESYLRMAIETNDTKAAEYIIRYAAQRSMFKDLIKDIYNMGSPVDYDDQTSELNDPKIAKLISKETISAIDLGCLLGLEGLINLLVQWKLGDPHHLIKTIEEGSQEIISALLEESFDINAKNSYGDNLLHIACWLNNLRLVKFLLARHKMHRTEIVVSIINGQQNCDKVFSNTILNINCQNLGGETSLHYACNFGTAELVALLLGIPEIDVNIQNDKGRTPIMEALLCGKWQVVKSMLDKKDLDVNVKDNNGNTIFHHSCRKDQLEIVNDLVVNHKVDINIKNNLGHPPIMEASYFRSWKVVEYLLGMQGLSLNIVTGGNTLLHIACRDGQLNIVKQLVANHKVDMNIKNQLGKTPIMEALYLKKRDIFGYLLIRKCLNVSQRKMLVLLFCIFVAWIFNLDL